MVKLVAYHSQVGTMRKSDQANVDRRLEAMIASVKEAGIRLTPQRLEILRVLAGSEDHPSAEIVLRRVQERMPTVSLDTVYRTLWRLNELRLVTTLGSSSNVVRFDPNMARHHHYVCERCGLVRDFESEELHAQDLPAAVKRFGTTEDVHVEVRGLCAKCRSAARKGPQQNPKKRSTK